MRTFAREQLLHYLLWIWLAACCGDARADALSELTHVSSLFAQGGYASDSSAYMIGATWDWHWKESLRFGEATGYWETSVGRWMARREHEGNDHAFITQLGVTPVFRLFPLSSEPSIFVELGVGANLLFPIYRTDAKRFSTTFNFGDHLAIGFLSGRHEVALRIQHYSNGGIKSPNPGENFAQLRYAFRY